MTTPSLTPEPAPSGPLYGAQGASERGCGSQDVPVAPGASEDLPSASGRPEAPEAAPHGPVSPRQPSGVPEPPEAPAGGGGWSRSRRKPKPSIAAPICKIDGCSEPVKRTRNGHGMGNCAEHLSKRAVRHVETDALNRFQAGYDVDSETGCWLWRGTKESGRYPHMSINGRAVRVHRWSYEYFVGPIPNGYLVLHSCDTRPCVNPEHLRPGTHTDNMRDRSDRGRSGQQRWTSCPHGHEYTPENTYLEPTPTGQSRKCRACRRARSVERSRERRASTALARIREWIAGQPVTANSEFGNGYREALRDIADLLPDLTPASPHSPAPTATDQETP